MRRQLTAPFTVPPTLEEKRQADQRKKRKKSGVIGVLAGWMERPMHFQDHVAGIYSGASFAAWKAGFNCLLHEDHVSLDINQLSRAFLDIPEGYLVVGCSPSDELWAALTAKGRPAVAIGWDSGFPGVSQVGMDDFEAGRMAAQHLIDKGHRRLATMGIEWAVRASKARRNGFLAAIQEAGLNPEAVRHFSVASKLPMKAVKLVAEFRRIDETIRPTAIFTLSAFLAMSVTPELQNRGIKVGQAISILSVDDPREMEHFHPRLSTICQPLPLIGEAAAQELVRRIEDPSLEPGKILLPGQLIERDSVAALGGSL